MSIYKVWGSNSTTEWTHLLLQTDDREAAKENAQKALDYGRFLFVAIDQDDKTIWSNDPDTPVTS